MTGMTEIWWKKLLRRWLGLGIQQTSNIPAVSPLDLPLTADHPLLDEAAFKTILAGAAADTLRRHSRMITEDLVMERQLRYAHHEAIARMLAGIVLAVIICFTLLALAARDPDFYKNEFFTSGFFKYFGGAVVAIVGFWRLANVFFDHRQKAEAISTSQSNAEETAARVEKLLLQLKEAANALDSATSDNPNVAPPKDE